MVDNLALVIYEGGVCECHAFGQVSLSDEAHMPAKQRFRYSDLPPEQAKELQGIVATLTPLLKKLRPTALEAGRQLKQAKGIVKHGSFALFCRDVMKTDKRMCEYYIKIADLAEEIGSDMVEMMPASSAAVLSSAPATIVSEVVEAMKDGEKCPSVRQIKARIRDTRGDGDIAAAFKQGDERTAGVASMLMKNLQKEDLVDFVDFLSAANKFSIVALCDKIRSHLTCG